MRPLTSRVTPDDIFLDGTLRSSTTPESCDETHTANLDLQRKMMLELAKDEYWKRVWIIQEIGLAQKRRVCFGTTAMYWKDFIMMLTLHQIPSEGPMLLDEQIDKRFKGSHRLKRLLSQHKHALCKDPRDKIYGLIGLAVDGHGFPRIDYDKSQFQIWTDTMEFMNSHRMFEEEKEDNIIEYGKLVKFLLMGVESTPLQEVLRPYTTKGEISFDANAEESRAFRIMGSLIGCIQSIGPSAKDVAGKLSEVDAWSFRVQANYQHDLGSAFAQSENLLGTILSKTEAEVSKLCLNHQSLISWGCRSRQGLVLGECLTWPTEEKSRLGSSDISSSLDTVSITKETANILLYQLYTGYGRTSSTPWKMGVAPGQAARGDLIFWVQGTKTALLVRPTEFSTFGRSMVSCTDYSARLQVVGTAMVAEDIADPSIDHPARLDELKQEGSGRRLELKLDAPTVYSCPPPL
ncbi:HET domain-containing protein [Colletotrichum cuscutae]|uniref:HET domain-containing protein n=1 Tax=Colletotrichum cuscutae TaxID=1209917 RepID=A0AAI9Y8I9_9PEZI|nr:HET domain-containing protein [Colletotrichum cuscutae]